MPEFETLRKIAKQALTSDCPGGSADSWLWDRTLRILRNVEHICRLPELAQKATSIDCSCLIAATLFSECGLVHGPSAHRNQATPGPNDKNDPELFNRSAQIASKQISDIIGQVRMDKVNKIIKESCNRFTNMSEAMVLSDARNLEDMGTVGLLQDFRRNIINGKNISDFIESWKCKIEYGYWQARIKESFRYKPVRQIAQHRLITAINLMELLAEEHNCTDIETKLMEILQN